MKVFRFLFNVVKFIVVFFITIELILQLVGYHDADKIHLLGSYPFVKTRTIGEWRQIYNQINADTASYFQYHPTLGWTHRPNSTSQDGLMHFNSAGIRGLKEYDIEPSDNVVRIVLLGSSVILSAEVADSSTLGFYLEKALSSKGKKVEVLNMAVGSYGNDQALLKWLDFAKDYQPDIVIQGVHLSECWINLNIFKYCSHPPTGILFSKPRAIINSGKLQWFNLPTVKPSNLVDSIVIGFEQQSFFEYEHFNEKIRYGKYFSDNFYLYKAYEQYTRIDRLKNIDEYPEGQRLMKTLMNELSKSVEETGAHHMILQLASYDDLNQAKWNKQLPHQNVWNNLIGDKNYFSNYPVFSDTSLRKLFVGTYASHYSGYGNQLIAEQLANYLMKKELIVKKQIK